MSALSVAELGGTEVPAVAVLSEAELHSFGTSLLWGPPLPSSTLANTEVFRLNTLVWRSPVNVVVPFRRK